MAENEDQNPETSLLSKLPSDETLEITILRETNEIVLRNPKDDKVVRFKANFEDKHPESAENENPPTPLTSEEFMDGITRLTKLGFTLSPSFSPSVVRKTGGNESIDEVEFLKLQEDYPRLPFEAGLVIFNTLTGGDEGIESLGGTKSLEKKSQTVRDFIIDDEFKAEFFFKHALKVPLLESVDWEVVIKTHERGVKEGISFPYALMMLTLHDTNSRAGNEHQNIAVAVNRQLIDKLLGVLTDVRAALESSSKICMEIGETNNEKEVKDD